jgi:hypothetical protein
MELERQAYLQEKERQERALEKKRRLGIPIKGEVLTRAEKEARIWAFMFVTFHQHTLIFANANSSGVTNPQSPT